MSKGYQTALWHNQLIYTCELCANDASDETEIISHLLSRHPEFDPIDQNNPPKVSCTMLTKDRSHLIPIAIHYYLRYHYENKELIVLDNGEQSIDYLIPKLSHIKYVRNKETLTMGELRNLAVDLATGDIIAHHDDDDWYHPDRLIEGVRLLEMTGRDLFGIRDLIFYLPMEGRAYQYRWGIKKGNYALGTSLLYRKRLWEGTRFNPAKTVGEDTEFFFSIDPKRTYVLPEWNHVIAIRHEQNHTERSQFPQDHWEPVDELVIQQAMGKDIDTYRHGVIKRIGEILTIAIYTRNQLNGLIENLVQILREIILIKNMGYEPELVLIDDASEDGTDVLFKDLVSSIQDFKIHIYLHKERKGNLAAKVQAFKTAKETGAKYLLLWDGLSEPIPGSLHALVKWLDDNPQTGAIHLKNQPGRTRPEELTRLDPEMIWKNTIDLQTDYTMFRKETWEQGIEPDPTFLASGLEDDFENHDLLFQMTVKGFVNQYFVGTSYRRMDVSPEWRNPSTRDDRKQYLLEKWENVPAISEGPLRVLKTEP